MTRITESTISMVAARLGGESPLPKFRDQQPSRVQEVAPVGLAAPELENILSFGTLSMLPYLEQDNYDRDRKARSMRAIVIDNGILRATILPELGGRLQSLFDISGERELLFANPVFQPANLSLRNAWFSGGVEWNGGSVPGHAASTCAPVFCHVLTTDRGPVLRLHDFDRISETAWQVDLFLPPAEARLFVHGRIVNPNDHDKLVYWWSNATVPATPGLRVMSPADYAIEHAPDDGHLERYRFPDQWGFDGSVPGNWQRATSVFFRKSGQERPWIAALHADGNGLAQVSTANMTGRKYFYFGAGQGGRHWMDFLSEPGKGAYVEIQAGIMPTQNQRLALAARSAVEWTECYFPFAGEAEAADYQHAVQRTEALLAEALPRDVFNEVDAWLSDLAGMTPDRTLCRGEAWGRLHEQLIARPISAGMDFETPIAREKPWDALVEDGYFSEAAVQQVPQSIVVSPIWETCIRRSLDRHGATWLHHLALGIMAMDRGDTAEAGVRFAQSNELGSNWLACRCEAVIAQAQNRIDDARSRYARALAHDDAPPELVVEYVLFLQAAGLTDHLDELLASLPPDLASGERLRILKAERALDAGDFDAVEELLDFEFATIREGELTLSRLWEGLVLGRAASRAGRGLNKSDKARALAEAPLPLQLNFVMSESER